MTNPPKTGSTTETNFQGEIGCGKASNTVRMIGPRIPTNRRHRNAQLWQIMQEPLVQE